MAGLRHRLVVCLTALSFASYLALPPAVRADDDPPVPHACTCDISGDISVCQNEQNVSYATVLTGIVGSTYSWTQISGPAVNFDTPTAPSTTIDFGAPGLVQIQCAITGTGGCLNCTPVLDITVNPTPSCTITGPAAVCTGTTNNYGGTGGISFFWSITGNGSIVGSNTNPTVDVLAGASGSYTLSLMVTDANSCVNTCSQIVSINPLPSAVITHNAAGSPLPILCPNWAGYVASVPTVPFCGIGNPPPAYLWTISAGGTIVGSATLPSVSFKVGTPGPTLVTLSVTVTDCNGCIGTSSQQFNVCNTGTCQSGQLRLAGPAGGCFDTTAPNNTFTVQLHMDNITCPIAGYQAFIGYDPLRVAYTGGSYTPSPFGQSTIPIDPTPGSLNHPNPGQIDLSRGISLFVPPIQAPSTGLAGTALLATLNFNVISNDGCDGVYVYFRPDPAGPGDGPRPPTRLTDLSGYGFGTIAVPGISDAGLVTVNAASIRIDGTAPSLTTGSIAPCYTSVALAETAALTATGASDLCSPCTLTKTASSSGTTCDIVITVTVTDCCLNSAQTTYNTRVDNTAPVITCPTSPLTIECNASTLPANTGSASATDNCIGVINIAYSDLSSLVNPTTPNGWSLFATSPLSNTPGGNGTADYVFGPAVPPLGDGSAHFNTGTDGSQSAQLRNSSWAGTRIDALTTLGYSTYATAWNGQQLPYLTIFLDTNGDNVRDDRLWFEPDYSSTNFGGSQPAPALNVWQSWDALAGKWYSDSGVGSPGAGAVTLATYLAAKPNATIINEGPGGIRIASGFASVGDVFNAYVDAFAIGKATSGITYNFEPAGCADYDITRTWTATDFCGNASSCVQTIQVRDTTAPVITCPPPATIECDEWAFTDGGAFAAGTPGIPFGVASGGVGIYYSVAPEIPANQAYLKTQFSGSNANGAPWTFSSVPLTGGPVLTWAGLFGQIAPPNQFGFDMVLPAPTYAGVPADPWLLAFDNTNGSIGGRVETNLGHRVLWKIGDYKDGSPNGPSNLANVDINSIIRGNHALGFPVLGDIDVFQQDVTLSGTVYTAVLRGRLLADGLIHWFNPATPNTPMPAFALNGRFYYSGTLTYDSLGDPGTDLIDFYEGPITVTANSPNAGLGFATATDNCTLFPAVTYTDAPMVPNGTCPYTGTVTRTWKAADACGNESTCTQLITIVDNTAPTITCAANVVVNPTAADLLDCDADGVNIVAPTATDNCDATVTIVGIRSDTLAVVTPGLNSFPPGVTTITWTATDDCTNAAICLQTVTVNAVSIAVNVELSPTIDLLPNLQRCITFQVFSCPIATPQTISKVLNFTNQGGDAIANDIICVPVATITCVTARDRLHTLRSRVQAGDGLLGAGPTYTANFLGARAGEPGFPLGTGHRLVGGNLNDDEFIDILDFGSWAGSYNTIYDGPDVDLLQDGNTDCSTPFPHADISGNGHAFSEDFTFIGINFLMFREANCCGLANVEPGAGDPAGDRPRSRPVTRISVPDLHARGMSSATAGDINHDGWLDMNDVMMAWFGLAPQPAPSGHRLAPMTNPAALPVNDRLP